MEVDSKISSVVLLTDDNSDDWFRHISQLSLKHGNAGKVVTNGVVQDFREPLRDDLIHRGSGEVVSLDKYMQLVNEEAARLQESVEVVKARLVSQHRPRFATTKIFEKANERYFRLKDEYDKDCPALISAILDRIPKAKQAKLLADPEYAMAFDQRDLKAFWSIILRSYKQRGKFTAITMTIKLHNSCQKSPDLFDEFVVEFREIVVALQEHKAAPNDLNLSIMFLLRVLPSTFGPQGVMLIDNFYTMEPLPVYEEIIKSLSSRLQVMDFKKNSAAPSTEPKDFASVPEHDTPAMKASTVMRICLNCGKSNHLSKHCPEEKQTCAKCQRFHATAYHDRAVAFFNQARVKQDVGSTETITKQASTVSYGDVAPYSLW